MEKLMPSESGRRTLRRHMNKVAHAGEDTRLDRIRRYYFEDGYELSPADEAYRLLLERVNQLLCAGHSHAQVKSIMEKGDELKRGKIRAVLNDSLELFGDMSVAAKRGLRQVLTEQFLTLAKLAQEQNDLEQQRKALEAVAKLNNLSGIEDEAKTKKRHIRPRYTTDASVLKMDEERRNAG